jgi:transcriptional regulator with XRE-family HTH domain
MTKLAENKKMRISRVLLGISQDELGRLCGVDQGRISRIERGYCSPTSKERQALSQVLKIPVEELFSAIGDENGD